MGNSCHKVGGVGFMGNVNGEADRGQVDPAYEFLCDEQMAEGLCSRCHEVAVIPGGDFCQSCLEIYGESSPANEPRFLGDGMPD